MTGVSSGLLRGGSYGSLQTHGSGQNGAMQSQNSFNLRKPSKSVLWGTREKERFLPCMYRYLGRRKVGMLILAVFALLAFMSGLFTINGDDASRSAHLIFERLRNTTYRVPSTLSRVGGSQKDTNSSLPSTMAICSESVFHPPIPRAVNAAAVTGFAAVHEHPCKDFALSPPPSGDRRHTGPRPCPVCYLPVEKAIASMPSLPSVSPVLHNLTYFQEENPIKTEPHGGSDFGGYPSLKQRNDSFNIEESMTVHCGFVKGCIPGQRTGFDIKEADLRELEQYYEVIVASAIFDKYDVIQQPTNVSDTARKNIPFFMFVDEETEAYIKNTSVLDSNNKVGLWRLIVVHNVPYNDGRRNGKVPKLLLHRLFPNVRYSIWVDGKLELVVDPYQVLERFLWRENATFAISRHYTRFDVFEEAEANKAAGKVENSSIDFQIEFYRKEGLTPYFDAKLPPSRGTSDVPEGCVIIREHIPITNLFTCLWFNEVDRFTSRDQLSFSTVRDKIMDKVPWSINMFMDCERRNFVVQAYHRELLEQRARAASAMPMIRSPPAGGRDHTAGRDPIKKNSTKRGKGRRHRKVNPGSKGNIAG